MMSRISLHDSAHGRAALSARTVRLYALLLFLLLCQGLPAAELQRVQTLFGQRYRLERPVGIAISAAGDKLAINDAGAGRILVTDLNGELLWAVGEFARLTGEFAVGWDGEDRLLLVMNGAGPVLSIQEKDPRQIDTVAVTVQGLAPESRIIQLQQLRDQSFLLLDDHEGQVLQVDAEWQKAKPHVGNGEGRGTLMLPTSLCLTHDGRLLVSDRQNFPVQLFSDRGRFLLALGWDNIAQQQSWSATGVTIDIQGNIWVVDETNRVLRKFNPAGIELDQLAWEQSLLRPVALIGTSAGQIILLDAGGSLLFYSVD